MSNPEADNQKTPPVDGVASSPRTGPHNADAAAQNQRGADGFPAVGMSAQTVQAGRDITQAQKIENTVNNGLIGSDLKEVLNWAKDLLRPVGAPMVMDQTGLVERKPLPTSNEEYAIQFRELSHEERLFVVVLRLFPGLDLPTFWQVYDQALATILWNEQPAALVAQLTTEQRIEEVRRQNLRLRSNNEWAMCTHAQVIQKIQEYREGFVQTITIDFFQDSAKGIAVRPFVEYHLDTYEHRLLLYMIPVLRKLGDQSLPGLRQAAARAVAILANIDFVCVQREILEPWSHSDQDATRDTVKYAIDQIIHDRKNDAHAVVLLQHWADPAGDFYWRQSWTAAACYELIGLHRFDLASSGLRALARMPDRIYDKYKPGQSISQADESLLDHLPGAIEFALFILAFKGKAPDVLHVIREWTRETVPKGSYLFWDLIILGSIARIFNVVFSLKQQDNLSAEEQETADVVLNQLAQNQEFRRCLADILLYIFQRGAEWRRSIFGGLLVNWIERMAELKLDHTSLLRVVGRMYRQASDVNRERIVQAVRRWVSNTNPAVRAAGEELMRSFGVGNNHPRIVLGPVS